MLMVMKKKEFQQQDQTSFSRSKASYKNISIDARVQRKCYVERKSREIRMTYNNPLELTIYELYVNLEPLDILNAVAM